LSLVDPGLERDFRRSSRERSAIKPAPSLSSAPCASRNARECPQPRHVSGKGSAGTTVAQRPQTTPSSKAKPRLYTLSSVDIREAAVDIHVAATAHETEEDRLFALVPGDRPVVAGVVRKTSIVAHEEDLAGCHRLGGCDRDHGAAGASAAHVDDAPHRLE